MDCIVSTSYVHYECFGFKGVMRFWYQAEDKKPDVLWPANKEASDCEGIDRWQGGRQQKARLTKEAVGRRPEAADRMQHGEAERTNRE